MQGVFVVRHTQFLLKKVNFFAKNLRMCFFYCTFARYFRVLYPLCAYASEREWRKRKLILTK